MEIRYTDDGNSYFFCPECQQRITTVQRFAGHLDNCRVVTRLRFRTKVFRSTVQPESWFFFDSFVSMGDVVDAAKNKRDHP